MHISSFTIRYISAVVIILVLLGGAIIWLWPDHKQPAKPTEQKQGSSQTAKPQTDKTKQKSGSSTPSTGLSTPAANGSKPTTTSTNTNTGTKPQAGSQTAANQAKKPATGSQLADTGPGDTALLFLGSSLAFAAAHNWRQRRRLNPTL